MRIFSDVQPAFGQIRRLTTPPVFPGDEDRTREAQVLHSVNEAILVLMLIMGIVTGLVADQKLLSLLIILVIIGVTLTTDVIMRGGRVQLASRILVTFMGLMVSIIMTFSGGLDTVSGSFFACVIALAVLFLGWRTAIFYTGGLLLWSLIVTLSTMSGHAPPRIFPLNGVVPWMLLVCSLTLVLIPLVRMQIELLKALQLARQQLAEREKISAVLKESEERARLISDVISDYTFYSTFSRDGRLLDVEVGGAFEAITGYTAEDFKAVGGWRGTLYSDDLAQDEADMATLRQNRQVVTEIRILKKGGEVRRVRVYARPVWNEEHNFLEGIIGAVRDITERHLERERLRASEEKFRTIFETAPFAITIARRDGTLIDTNPAFLQMLGLPREQVIGKSPVEFGLFSASMLQQMEHQLEQHSETGNIELNFQRADGRLLILVSSTRVLQIEDEPQALSVIIDISDRKYTEEALAQERRLLHAVITHLPDNIYVKDRQGRFVLNNPESLRILGASSQEEVLGKNDYDFFAHELAARWEKEHEEIMRSGQPVLDDEIFQPWYEGRRRWIVASTIPLHDEQGEIIGLVGINRDISAYKRAEEIARRSEALLRALLDATTDIAYLMAPDGTFLTVNRTVADFFGKSVDELIGQNSFDPMNQAMRELRIKYFEIAMQTRAPVRWEENNGMVWRDSSIYPVLAPDGTVEAIAVYSRNISEQKRLAAELQRYTAELEHMVEERTGQLRRAKEQIETILNNTSDAIALAQHNGDIKTTNPAFLSAFGEQYALERILWSVTDQEQLATVGTALINVIWDQERQQIAAQIVGSDGKEKDVDLAFIPVQSAETDGQQGILISAHDITHLKELERFKARFIADALHDLATPITGLSSRLYLLKRTPEKLDDHVRALENQVAHLRHLLSDLRTLSQLDRRQLTLELATSDLNEIVQRVFDTYEPVAIGKKQVLMLETQPLPPLQLDSRQIERVMVNLLSNAVNYTPDHKSIRIRTMLEDDSVVITIADEGIGIAPEQIPHVFERFYRTEQARRTSSGGTGLGLAIVREIIELHGGKVTVTSEPGHGSTFTLRLPCPIL